MTNYAVIGAGYGDEGKGLITDYLARKLGPKNTLVARVNGGAQAGHTVVTDQHRHVFGHFGSGTLAGSRTYLSSNFVVNPFAFLKEWDQLQALGIQSVDGPYHYNFWAHPSAIITTIWDIAYNQLQEISRGTNKHGSCGLGINATVTRNLDPSAQLVLNDCCYNTSSLSLLRVQEYYKPLLEPFEHLPEYQKFVPLMNVDSEWAMIQRTLETLKVTQLNFNPFNIRKDTHVIFEGAQGLGLDELMGEFPHVTRSITGLPSAIHTAAELGVKEITPVYVTRCYATRHGAGPLKWENLKMDFSQVVDQTNKPNPWQDTLRFAPLDLNELYKNIQSDWERSQAMATVFKIKLVTPQLAVTCLDQFDNISYIHPGLNEVVETRAKDFVGRLRHQNQVQVKYTSWGPRASDVREID